MGESFSKFLRGKDKSFHIYRVFVLVLITVFIYDLANHQGFLFYTSAKSVGFWLYYLFLSYFADIFTDKNNPAQ